MPHWLVRRPRARQAPILHLGWAVGHPAQRRLLLLALLLGLPHDDVAVRWPLPCRLAWQLWLATCRCLLEVAPPC